VLLSDGSSFFVYPEVPETLGLKEGTKLDAELLEELQRRRERYLCREKAVELLARREHSSAELKRKLLQREFATTIVERVLQELQNKEWLNDERFARIYAETRLRRKPTGENKLAEELLRKGVPRAIIDRTVDEYCTKEYQRRAVEEAAQKLLRRVGKNREKLLRGLQTRGFSMDMIRRCSVFRQMDNGDE